MLVKIQKSYRYVVSICDSELVGKRFEEGKFQLDVKESFYKGEELPKDKVVELMQDMAREDATFNIVGKEAIKSALEAGIITKEAIGTIQGVPFSLVLL